MLSGLARCSRVAVFGSSGTNFQHFRKMSKLLTLKNINPRVTGAEYAVRGELVMRAEKLTKVLEAQKAGGARQLPFDEIVYCNIGNPQSLGQAPLTYFRQLVALLEYPELMKSEHVDALFPEDVIERAQRCLKLNPAGLGAYSHSQGIPFVRRSIADFIERRDGYPANPDHIFIHNGASPAVQDVLRLIIRGQSDGIMVPIPQYPLYSASITLLGGSFVGYYLDEAKGWGLSVAELKRAFEASVAAGVVPRALCVINPGNPTGQLLSAENMQEVIAFCREQKLVLLADEVYQENNYIKEKRPFVSFKKALRDLGPAYEDFELFSFHTISKGFLGECGQRSGYVEVVGVSDEVRAQLYKLASVLLCPNTAGQILMDVMVNPPKPGEASYELYVKERDAIYESLKRRATKLVSFLNAQKNVSCNAAEGAMYAFVNVQLPPKAVAAAAAAGMRPDDFYAISLLEQTGICVVPGSGFGQRDGTFHFRTTFLPPESKFDDIMARFGKFNAAFSATHENSF
eukprot:TRINITY_DN7488_c0_g2_i1.p1 TRINITY_DN7488_c0_g2~~TRINITY_DN7488_c0_g2_i1.p1  ORF type:complete len:515 (-),score=233.51 TRINITY_DN7488_c0_g2_i1:386-1930(-)